MELDEVIRVLVACSLLVAPRRTQLRFVHIWCHRSFWSAPGVRLDLQQMAKLESLVIVASESLAFISFVCDRAQRLLRLIAYPNVFSRTKSSENGFSNRTPSSTKACEKSSLRTRPT